MPCANTSTAPSTAISSNQLAPARTPVRMPARAPVEAAPRPASGYPKLPVLVDIRGVMKRITGLLAPGLQAQLCAADGGARLPHLVDEPPARVSGVEVPPRVAADDERRAQQQREQRAAHDP